MSTEQEQNKALHRRFFEDVINCGNVDVLDQIVPPHFKSRTAIPGFPQGREGLKAWVRTLLAAFPDIHITVDQQVAERDRVTSYITFRGTQMAQFQGIPPLGQALTVHAVEIARFQKGRYVERWDGLSGNSLSDNLGAVYPPRRHSLPILRQETGANWKHRAQS